MILGPDEMLRQPVVVYDSMRDADNQERPDIACQEQEWQGIRNRMNPSREPAIDFLICHPVGLDEIVSHKMQQDAIENGQRSSSFVNVRAINSIGSGRISLSALIVDW